MANLFHNLEKLSLKDLVYTPYVFCFPTKILYKEEMTECLYLDLGYIVQAYQINYFTAGYFWLIVNLMYRLS